MTDPPRTAERFTKNTELESLLGRLNAALAIAERESPAPARLAHPVIILAGAPRSGTTLFMQWLQASGRILVPTNLISRFYACPSIGLMVQQMLVDPAMQYRDELEGVHSEREWRSDFGKTRGILGHNSFFYFWRQFLPIGEPRPIDPADVARIDGPGLRHAMARLCGEAGTPVAFKGILVQFHLRLLRQILGDLVVVHLTRDPIDTMASLLRAREAVHSTTSKWWSCFPPGAERFEHAEPALQVAAQVRFTNASIASECGMLPSETVLTIDYHEFCRDPAEAWRALVDRVIVSPCYGDSADAMRSALTEYRGPRRFDASVPEIPTAERRVLEAAWLESERSVAGGVPSEVGLQDPLRR